MLSSFNIWLDPICMHLTSERVKERGDAMTRLVHILKDPKRVKDMSSDDATRIVKSFFSLISIEFKYSIKAESTLTSVNRTKLSNLITEAKFILRLFIQFRRFFNFDDSISDIFECIISLLKQEAFSDFSLSFLEVINLVVESAFYRSVISKSDANRLLNYLMSSVQVNSFYPPLIESLSKYFNENRCKSSLKRMANFISELLLQDSYHRTEAVTLPLLNALSNCVALLSKESPIFVSTLPVLIQFHLLPQKPIFLKWACLEKLYIIIDQLITEQDCLPVIYSTQLHGAFLHESVLRKIKFEDSLVPHNPVVRSIAFLSRSLYPSSHESASIGSFVGWITAICSQICEENSIDKGKLQFIINNTDISNPEYVKLTLACIAQYREEPPSFVIPFVLTHSARGEFSCLAEKIFSKVDSKNIPTFSETYERYIGDPMKLSILKQLFLRQHKFTLWSTHSFEAYGKLINGTLSNIASNNWKKYIHPPILKLITCPLIVLKSNSEVHVNRWKTSIIQHLRRYLAVIDQFFVDNDSSSERNLFKTVQELYCDFICLVCSNDTQFSTQFTSQWNSTLPRLKDEDSLHKIIDLFIDLFDINLSEEHLKLLYSSLIKLTVGGINSSIKGDLEVDEFSKNSFSNNILFCYLKLLCHVIYKLQFKSAIYQSLNAIISDCFVFMKHIMVQAADLEIKLFVLNTLRNIPESWMDMMFAVFHSLNREHSPLSFFQFVCAFQDKLPLETHEQFLKNFVKVYLEIFSPNQLPLDICEELKTLSLKIGSHNIDLDIIEDDPDDLDYKITRSSLDDEKGIRELAELLSSLDSFLLKHPRIKRLFSSKEGDINIPLLSLACTKNPKLEAQINYEIADSEWYYFMNLLSGRAPEISSMKYACIYFAPSTAKCLLDFHAGAKGEAEVFFSSLKSCLSPSCFEQEFKHKFLRILSYMSIFSSTDDRYSGTGTEFFSFSHFLVFIKAVEHACKSLNISSESVKSSVYAKVLWLEFEQICSESWLSKIYPKLVTDSSELLSKLTPKIEFIATPSECVLSLEADPLLHICHFFSRPSPSQPALAAKFIIDVLERFSPAQIPNYLTQYLIPKNIRNVFKTKVSKERQVPDSIKTFHDLLEYSGFVCCLNIRYAELWKEVGDNQQSLIYLLAKAFSEDSLMIPRIGDIEFKQIKDMSLAKSFMSQQEIVVEAIKMYQTFSLKGSLMTTPSMSMSNSLRALFSLECGPITELSLSTIKFLYSELKNQEYLDYIRYMEDPLLYISDSQSQASFDAKITESHLLNQHWSLTEISDFNIQKTDDWLLARVLSGEPAPSILNSASELDLAASFVLNSLMMENDIVKLMDLGFKSWEKAKNTPIASKLRLIKALKCNPCESMKSLAKYCEAKILWECGYREAAVAAITFASTMAVDHEASILKNKIYLKAGIYLWETRQAPIKHIAHDYFYKIDLSNASTDFIAKASFTMAAFFDENYKRMYSSDTFKTRRKLLGDAQRELENFRRFIEFANSKDADAYAATMKTLETQVAQETARIEGMNEDRQKLAIRAAENYVKSISLCDKYDLAIFRLVALWFAFKQLEEMNQIFSSDSFPPSKLLPLIYQLTARCEVNENGCLFQDTLQDLLLKVLLAYPNQCAYQLLAMKAGADCLGKKRKIVGVPSVQEKRALAASQILSKAKSSSNSMNTLIGDMELLSSALVEVAQCEVPCDTPSKSHRPFETKWKIKNLSNLSCSIPSVSLSESKEVDTLVSFSKKSYQVLGGINMPKIIECVGSSGRLYKMLVKAKDDLRQDAVMEQSFLLVNQILKRSKNMEGLYMNTYHVVPLQPLAGIIEWIEDATPIGDYLNSAHERRHPEDITPKDARLLMKREFDRPESNPISKIRTYKDKLIPKFKPAFHYFFLETTFSCEEWFQKRLAYIRSVAVSSMVGYIVGLGDRHCQNIMVGTRSGEIIHIDLNMIFEMGTQLRIPERVPFRLTRDMVDGMGYLGLEAGFTSFARKTLIALRQKIDLMLMIMEAFKYDPLHRWSRKLPVATTDTSGIATLNTVNDEDQVPKGGDDEEYDENVPKEAERALLRVREKLQGVEMGSVLSESGQVAYLIQKATDEDLLAQMYPGWQPWM